MISPTKDLVSNSIPNIQKRLRFLLFAVLISSVLVVVTLALSAATLGVVESRLDSKDAPSEPKPSLNSRLAESIEVDDVMAHLRELQRIADTTGGNRAVNTAGFNQTLDYITSHLRINTNFNVTKSFFPVRNFVIGANPTFSALINGGDQDFVFSRNISQSEFFYVQYTRPYNSPGYRPLTAIPNVGCTDQDWQTANPLPGSIVLVKRGDCTFLEKAALATKYQAGVLLFYNDGTSSDRFAPIFASLGMENELPALFLSYDRGQQLFDAATNPSTTLQVRINIYVQDETTYPVGNICADTPTGDPTQTIVIGSHSDSVPAGPGINDNGSGSAANLALAVTLARLYERSDYGKFPYRVRFCWWGAEEIGLLGSADHVRKAKDATKVGERLKDYLINLNYDMLGSPNFIFGIYDGTTAPSTTPSSAIPGSNQISALFKAWFEGQNLPWTYTDFSGRSDYGPFLAEGIVAGGLFSGADVRKTMAQRDYYDEKLGQGLGGIAEVIQDPCYHQPADSLQNINVFAFEKMVQAAAYALEHLGQMKDLKGWLYPSAELQRLSSSPRPRRPYNSINDYFGLPYL